MPTKRRLYRNRLNQRAWQNGFEAGADEATKRLSAQISDLNNKLACLERDKKELNARIKWDERETRRMGMAREFIQAMRMIIDP